MTAKTKSEFMMAKRNIHDKYLKYIKTNKAVLKLSKDVHFIPDPHKYNGTPGRKVPTMRKILASERSFNLSMKWRVLTCSCALDARSVI